MDDTEHILKKLFSKYSSVHSTNKLMKGNFIIISRKIFNDMNIHCVFDLDYQKN